MLQGTCTIDSIIETDDVRLTNLTTNLNPMRFNETYASETESGKRLVDGTFVSARVGPDPLPDTVASSHYLTSKEAVCEK